MYTMPITTSSGCFASGRDTVGGAVESSRWARAVEDRRTDVAQIATRFVCGRQSAFRSTTGPCGRVAERRAQNPRTPRARTRSLNERDETPPHTPHPAVERARNEQDETPP